MNEFSDYMPARLVRGVRWYVEYYQTDPMTKERRRFREYHQLNRIDDLKERYRKGIAIVHHLNAALLPYGHPFTDTSHMPMHISLIDGVTLALSVKQRSDRSKTVSSYNSIVQHFISHIKKNKMEELPLRKFGSREASEYMDVLTLKKKIKPRTFNNYKQVLTAIWNELIQRGYVSFNPFAKISRLSAPDKDRRMMEVHEAQIILDYCLENDKIMALSILLLYYCFVRPGEQRQMRVHHIDLTAGTVTIPGTIAKNKKTEMVTIPKALIPVLQMIGIDQWYAHDFIFGKQLKSHPDTMCGVNALAERHKKILTHLHKSGKLRSIKGISLYSWKDTGAMLMIRQGVDAYEVMRQMRHSDLSVTQKYLKSLHSINAAVRDMPITLCLPSDRQNKIQTSVDPQDSNLPPTL